MTYGKLGAVAAVVVIIALAGFSVLQMRETETIMQQRDQVRAVLDDANVLVGRSERDVADLEQRLGEAAQELANLRDIVALVDSAARAEDAAFIEACIIDQNGLINDMLSDRQVTVGQTRLDDLALSCNTALERTARARAGQ